MCDKCDELDAKIEHHRRLASGILDRITLDGIHADRIQEMEAQKLPFRLPRAEDRLPNSASISPSLDVIIWRCEGEKCPRIRLCGTNGTGRRNRSWPEALKREIVAAVVCAGVVGFIGCWGFRGVCEPSFRLAKALWRRGAWAGGPVGSAIVPRGGHGGNRMRGRHLATIGGYARRSEIGLAVRYRVHVSSGVDALALRRACSMCWSDDDPRPLGCARLARGWTNRYAARNEWSGSTSPGSAAALIPMPAIFTFLEGARRRPDQGSLARRPRHVALRQKRWRRAALSGHRRPTA